MVCPPMPTLTLDHDALKEWLPHRGANIIPDLVTLSPDRMSSTSTTHIEVGDLRGRELMGRRDSAGDKVWYEPFIAEALALTGIPLLREHLGANVAVFSMLSRINLPNVAPLHRPLTGHARLTRVRGGFFTFTTSAECDGKLVLEAEVMAGSAAMSEICSFPVRPFHGQLPSEPVGPAALAWKDAHLRFADQIVHADPAEGRLAVAYTYPVNHPFVATHFPEAALMMGVTQWAAVADAAWLARSRFGMTGAVVATGGIRRQDGSEVMDVRELVLEPTGGVPRLASTKRIAWREPVRPGDGLMVEVTVSPRA